MVEGTAVGAFLRAAPGVGDLGGAQFDGLVLGLFEIGIGGNARLDQQDLAVLADGVGHLDVGRGLDRPSLGFFQFIAGCFSSFEFPFAFFRFFGQANGFLGFPFRFGLRERQLTGAGLVDLLETAAFAAAAFVYGGKTKGTAVDAQVGFGFGVVVSVEERDRLWAASRRLCRFAGEVCAA